MGWGWIEDGIRSFGRNLDPTYSKGTVGRVVDKGSDMVRDLSRGDFEGAWDNFVDMSGTAFDGLFFNAFSNTRDAIIRWLLGKLPEQDYQDRKVMVRHSDAAFRVVYGRARVGGVVRYLDTDGTDKSNMHIILVFANHSCAEIERVYFDDKLAFIGDTPQGEFVGKAFIVREHGKQVAANATIVASTPSAWNNSHKLLGDTYAYIRLNYDDSVYRSGLPNISALIRGKDDIYNPSTDSYGYTDNHALILRDFISNSDFGYGAESSEIDNASFISGAAICDQMVTTGAGRPQEKRYTVNGSFSIDGEPGDVFGKLLQAGAASVQFVQGKFIYIPGVYTAPVNTYDESDIISGLQIVPVISTSERFNCIRGTYVSLEDNGEVVDFPPIEVDAYITQDKQELYQDSNFPFSNSGTLCRRLAKIALEQSRYGTQLSIKMSYRILRQSVGDRIALNVSDLGWSGKVYRITNMVVTMESCEVTLTEDASGVWSWTEGDAVVLDSPPALNIPTGRFISAPTNFTAIESLFISNDETTVRNKITFSWDGQINARNFEIQGSHNGGSWIPINEYIVVPAEIYNDPLLGLWQFRVRAVNSLGVVSAWTTLSITTIGKTAPPENVSGFVGVIKPYSIEFRWDAVPDLDLEQYEIRIGSDWEAGATMQSIRATRWEWETRPSGTERILIKARDTSGNYSINAAAAELVMRNPDMPSIIARVVDNNVMLYWQNCETSFAIRGYEISRGATYALSERIGEITGTFQAILETEAGEYNYWVTAIDVAGNRSESGNVQALVDQPPDFVLLTDQNIDLSTATTTNMYYEAVEGCLIAPVNTTETWRQHFQKLPGWQAGFTADSTAYTADSTALAADASGIQSIQELQLDNGYPIYAQPSNGTATLVKVIDMGATVDLSRIRINPEVEVVAGTTTTVRWWIGVSSDGVTFTEQEFKDTVQASFRYVRIRAEVTTDSDKDLIKIWAIGLVLDVKIKSDQGNGTANASDVGGTVVFFNRPFIDVESITLTANSTTPVTIVYDFVDAPNPVSFKVLAFNQATGARITVPFSWFVRGV